MRNKTGDVPELPSTSSLVVISGLVPVSEGSGLGEVVSVRVGSESFGKRTSIGASEETGRFENERTTRRAASPGRSSNVWFSSQGTRERGVRRARRTVSSKFGLVDLLSIFSYVYFGWLRELATGPHSQKRASPMALC